MPDALPLASVHHRMRGRVRIRFDRPIPDLPALELIVHQIGSMDGVERVAANADTGSLTIHHAGDFEPIAKAIADEGLMHIRDADDDNPMDPVAAVASGLAGANAAVGRMTLGRADLIGLAFIGLVGGGIVQMARGRIAGPALTLFGQAATLAMLRPSSGSR